MGNVRRFVGGRCVEIRKRLAALRVRFSRAWVAEKARQVGRVLLNPRLLLCLGIAWLITNGWSYILFGLGMLCKINWMRAVGGAYMSFLWLPFTPEKLITVALAILLLRLLYPKDAATLGMLRAKLARFRRSRGVE